MILLSADLFQNLNFKKNLKRYMPLLIRVSNNLDPDQALGFVLPDLGPSCLQTLSAGATGR